MTDVGFCPLRVLKRDAKRGGVGVHCRSGAAVDAIIVSVGNSDGSVSIRSSISETLTIVEDLPLRSSELWLGVDSNLPRSAEGCGARDGVTSILLAGGVVVPSSIGNHPFAFIINIRSTRRIGILDFPRDTGVHGFAKNRRRIITTLNLMRKVRRINGINSGSIVDPFANHIVTASRSTVVIINFANSVRVAPFETILGGHGAGDRLAGEVNRGGLGGVGDADTVVGFAGEIAVLTVVVIVEDGAIITEIEATMLSCAADIDVDSRGRAVPLFGFIISGNTERAGIGSSGSGIAVGIVGGSGSVDSVVGRSRRRCAETVSAGDGVGWRDRKGRFVAATDAVGAATSQTSTVSNRNRTRKSGIIFGGIVNIDAFISRRRLGTANSSISIIINFRVIFKVEAGVGVVTVANRSAISSRNIFDNIILQTAR